MQNARRRSQGSRACRGRLAGTHTLPGHIRTDRWAEPSWGSCHTPHGKRGHPSRERWAACGQRTRDTGDTRSCVGSVPAPSRAHLQSGEQPRKQSLSPQAAPAVPAHPLHSPHVGTDDLTARRERVQGKDLLPQGHEPGINHCIWSANGKLRLQQHPPFRAKPCYPCTFPATIPTVSPGHSLPTSGLGTNTSQPL